MTDVQDDASQHQADEQFMRRALELAKCAADAGEVPVGAVLVRDGEIVGEGYNSTITASDPSAHAEMVAIRAAGQRLGNYRLSDTTLYVTIEPCAMCAGAIVHARVARLVYAAPEPRAGAVASQQEFLSESYLNHRVEVCGGVLEDDGAALIQSFFRARRGN